MELWNKARSFAEETAKRTQDLTREAAKRSQDLSKLSNIIAETSKEIASEASKRADQLRAEAIKRADQIKHLAEGANPNPNKNSLGTQSPHKDLDLETFGITDEFREFITGITVTTFQDFPLQDDTELSDVPAVSNVRQDLTEWQEKHAHLVLSAVKEISRLRYELCPRVMKERKFWRIYFILVNNHIAPYEKRYMEDGKIKSSEQVNDYTEMEPSKVESTSAQETQEVKKETVASTSSTEQDLEQVKDHKVVEPSKVRQISNHTSDQMVKEVKQDTRISTEQDLDVFLLGDTGDSDDDQVDDGNDGDFDDDLDKLVDSSDDEKEKL